MERNPNLDLIERIPNRPGWIIRESLIQADSNGHQALIAISEEDERIINLVNRHLEIIDNAVGGKFLELMIKKANQCQVQKRKAVIAEIGGGILSKTAKDALKHPMLKNRIKYINSDFFAITDEDDQDLEIKAEDFATSSIESESVDAVISFQVLNYISDEKYFEFLKQVARILAKGGEAYLDIQGAFFQTEREHATFKFAQDDSWKPEWAKYLKEQRVTLLPAFRKEKQGPPTMIYMAKTTDDGTLPMQ